MRAVQIGLFVLFVVERSDMHLAGLRLTQDSRGLDQGTLARGTMAGATGGKSELDLSSTVGKRSATSDTARSPSHWFRTSPEFWMDLLTAHDVRTVAEHAGDEIAELPTSKRVPVRARSGAK